MIFKMSTNKVFSTKNEGVLMKIRRVAQHFEENLSNKTEALPSISKRNRVIAKNKIHVII